MTILQILKLLGVFVTFVSGVLATAFETKKDAGNGKKQMNGVGLTLLILLIAGSFLTASTQIIEDNNKAKEAAAQKSLDIKHIAQILETSERIANPIRPILYRASVDISLDDSKKIIASVKKLTHNDPEDYTTCRQIYDESNPDSIVIDKFMSWVGSVDIIFFDNKNPKLELENSHGLYSVSKAVMMLRANMEPDPNRPVIYFPFFCSLHFLKEGDREWVRIEVGVDSDKLRLGELYNEAKPIIEQADPYTVGATSALDLAGLNIVAISDKGIPRQIVIKFPSAYEDMVIPLELYKDSYDKSGD